MKVLIVDDEVIIRTGLCTMVEWAENGFSVLPPAESAEEALERFLAERPELIFTDIRMTGMSGLDLVREVKRESPDTEIIVISGYDDFDYAREALREGVSDYLLKTCEPEEIIQSALQAKARILQKRREKEETGRMEAAAKRSLLEQLLDAKLPFNETLVHAFGKQFPELQTALGAQGLMVLRAVIAGADADLHAEWGESWASKHSAAWLPWYGGLLLVVPAERTENGWDRAEQLIALAERAWGRRIFAAAGIAAKSVPELRQTAETANEAFTYRWLLPGTRLIRYESVAQRAGMRTVCTEEEERSLIAVLKSGSGESLEAWVREAIERIRADAEATPRTAAAYLQSLLVTGYRWLERAAESIGDDRPLPPWEPLSADGLIADAEGELTRRLMPLLSRYAGMAARSSPIPRAIAYIREHIGENVTLEQVAGHVHLHPNYFSEMFKRETGQNFANYVREAKMRRAQHLLSETPAKISEVARQVGYTDVKHFNRLFKQYTGMTPSEYRENI